MVNLHFSLSKNQIPVERNRISRCQNKQGECDETAAHDVKKRSCINASTTDITLDKACGIRSEPFQRRLNAKLICAIVFFLYTNPDTF